MKKEETAKPKMKKGLKTFLIVLGVLLGLILIFVLLCVSTYIPRSPETDYNSDVVKANPLITTDTLVSAHRAGKNLAPENTLSAFQACFKELGSSIDFLEFDLHLTKDNKLILLHDDTLDRTSDCTTEKFNQKKVKPHDYTLAELKRYNMGYNFEKDGKYIYREKGADLSFCRIVSIEEVLDYIKIEEARLGKKMHFTIEIKDSGDRGKKAVDILCGILDKYKIKENTVMASFHGEVNKHITEKHPDITRSASIPEALGFYFSCMFGVDLSKKDLGYKVLNIPYKSFVLNLGKKSIVDYAHTYGLAIHYWTINKEKDIEYLTSIGADGIITDKPDVAYKIISEQQQKEEKIEEKGLELQRAY